MAASNSHSSTMLDRHRRDQKGLKLSDSNPDREDGTCACEVKLEGRKTRWASRECNDIAYQKARR
jgi:hypothetical protein